MHPIVKHRKHISRFLIAVVIIVILFTAASFILGYRLKEIAERLVSNQTNGQYTLTLNTLHLSVWRGKIELENAQILFADSLVNHRVKVHLPAIYFKLNSWQDLLFRKKLSIDSVTLTQPLFEVFEEQGNDAQEKIIFQSVGIFNAINVAVDLLNVRSFHLYEGSFVYHPVNNGLPFESRHINISITNFGRNDNNTHRFLSTDDFEIFIGKQEWKDQHREIKFKQLHLSGRNQSLEVDSIRFFSSATDNHSTVRLNIDKLTFNSKHLSSFYENNELLIDTLRFLRPSLQLQLEKDPLTGDTSSVISESLKSLFTNIHITFFDIHKGQFTIDQIADGQSSHYATEKTNLKINDITIRPNELPFLTSGNIDLKLKRIHFYTPDSLYQLTVDEFDLYNNDLRFKKAFFSPANKNHRDPTFFITVPVLTLKHVDLKKLMEKQLNAGVAVMHDPVVTIVSKNEKKTKAVSGSWPSFYDGLGELSNLMEVNTLKIKDGKINYQSLYDSVNVRGLNVSILLNDFLKSKSLSEMRHSIPHFDADEIKVHSKGFSADISQLRLLGSIRGTIKKIEFTSATGVTLKGKEIDVQKMNWEELRKNNAIVADSINIDELTFRNDSDIIMSNVASNDLPLISIRKLGINKWKVSYAISPQSDAKAKGKDILFTNLSTQNNKLLWSNLSGTFSNFEYQSPSFTAASDKIKFELPGSIRLSRIQADLVNSTGTIHSLIPEINLETTITSTDFSGIEFPLVIVNQPIVRVTQPRGDHSAPGNFTLPFNFAVSKLNLIGAQIVYKATSGNDSLEISSIVNASINSLKTSKRQSDFLQFSNMNMSVAEFKFHNNKLHITVPSFEFAFTEGKIHNDKNQAAFQSFVKGTWNNASVNMLLKNASTMVFNNFSGMLVDADVDLEAGKTFEWKKWMDKISIQTGRFLFCDSSQEMGFNNISWDRLGKELRVDSFFLQPRLGPQEYFSRINWQSDYIRLNGDELTVSGIDFDKWNNDSLLKANKISLDDVDVDVYRDKRIPFKHGREKMMPAQLLNSIRYPFSIDSVIVKDGDVTYHEFSSITNREGIVPLENINVTIKNVTNYHSSGPDTLTIRGKAKLLNSSIKKFRYAEAYDDSLGSFRLSVKVSPMRLNEFSKITNPLAAVNIEDGRLDTMVVRISGNKYAAIGEMIFYYHDLKFTLLDHEDATRKRISLSFVNFVANRFVIKTNNRKQSRIFYIRDREKFVFNYWIKAMMSGMLTSAGVKSNKDYEKQYQKLRHEYVLPALTF